MSIDNISRSLITLCWCVVIVAQGAEPIVCPPHYRFPKFLTLDAVPVYQAMDTNSPILETIPRWRLVYPDTTKKGADPDWMAISEHGTGRYPCSYVATFNSYREKIDFRDGKFVFRRMLLDADRYVEIRGFVQTKNLSSASEDNSVPYVRRSVVGFTNLWSEYGIDEPRFIPNDPRLSPYSAIVGIVVKANDGRYSEPFGTGFFIETNNLIASAGHVGITTNEDSLEFGKNGLFAKIVCQGQDEFIHLTKVASACDSSRGSKNQTPSRDWAVYRLDSTPKAPITVLHFPTPGKWSTCGTVPVVTIGFGNDLLMATRSLAGKFVPHADTAALPVSGISLEKTDDNHLVFYVRCQSLVICRGDSGGPLVFYNDDSNQFEILGVCSCSNMSEDMSLAGAKFTVLTQAAELAYHKHASELTAKFGVYWTNGFVPGSAAVSYNFSPVRMDMRKSTDYIAATDFFAADSFWLLNEELIDTVQKEIGLSPRGKADLMRFNTEPGAIVCFLPKPTVPTSQAANPAK